MHGFRRYVADNVLSLTGNLACAGQYIGDTDIRTLSRSYVRARPDELRDVANAISLGSATKPQRIEKRTAPNGAGSAQ
jgi:hypothetical protein